MTAERTAREPIATTFSTSIGAANPDRVSLRDLDLAADVIGAMSYTETLLLAVTGRRPSPAEVRVTDAVLVSLIDHGMQPSALVSRLTFDAAPDALQGAIAAGLLGAGSSVLGSMDHAARLLDEIGGAVRAGAEERAAVTAAVDALLADDRKIPGVGHRLHKRRDPRASRLLEVSAREGIAEDEIRRLHLIAELAAERTGTALPVNATGAAAAILLGVGLPWRLQRGVAVISRAAGLLAHIGEESEQPISPEFRRVLRAATWLDD